jgi:hypothetical protein
MRARLTKQWFWWRDTLQYYKKKIKRSKYNDKRQDGRFTCSMLSLAISLADIEDTTYCLQPVLWD